MSRRRGGVGPLRGQRLDLLKESWVRRRTGSGTPSGNGLRADRPAGAAHRGRLVAVAVTAFLLLGLLVGRLAQWQLLDPGSGRTLPAAAATRTIPIPAVRGRILARDGTPLATNAASVSLTMDRREWVREPARTRASLTELASLLGRPAAEVIGRAHVCGEPEAPAPPVCWNGSPQAPIPVATGIDPARALTFLEHPERHPGFAAATTAVRSYPRPGGTQTAHLLGYLGHVTEAELASSVDASAPMGAFDLVGRAGLEAQYDESLRGTPGADVVEIDPRGLVTGTRSHVDATPGRDLVTSIDVTVQAAAESALAAGVTEARSRGEVADSAAAVVLEVATGAVVAAASFPGYDPNVWTGGISANAYAALTDDGAGRPLLSRVTDVALAPASTIKVLSVPAAVRAGDPLEGTYPCPASLRIGDRTFSNFESQAHGPLTFPEALQVSCDTIFYAAAERSWQAQGGIGQRSDAGDPFIQVDRAFGLGARTGIDLPHESPGAVPGREFRSASWQQLKDDLCRRATDGYPEVAASDPERAAYLTALAVENCATGYQYRAGDAANLSIGQGELAVTPLQLAVVYAAIANGGTVLTPRIGQALLDPTTGVSEDLPVAPTRPAGLDPAVGEAVRAGLRAVVTDGTAAGAFAGMAEDWPVAGKTGTAEVFGKGDTAWFASYAPADTPRYAVVTVVTQGGQGGETAAPIARRIHETLRTIGR